MQGKRVAAAVIAIALAGCPGCSGEGSRPAATTSSAPASAAGVAGVPEDWTVTAADMPGLLEKQRLGLAKMMHVDAKLAATVRPGKPMPSDTALPLAAQCLERMGFRAEVSQGGVGFVDDIPEEQAAAANFAMYKCNVENPVDPRVNMMLPKKQARAQYQYLVEKRLPCLRKAFPSVKFPDPPTMDTWLGDYYHSGKDQSPWEPANVLLSDPEVFTQAYATCAPHAPGLYPPLS